MSRTFMKTSPDGKQQWKLVYWITIANRIILKKPRYRVLSLIGIIRHLRGSGVASKSTSQFSRLSNSARNDGEQMPVSSEYQRATDDFYKLLTDARDSARLTTTNQAYTMVQGVFQVFRRRLEVKEAIRFLNVLPVGARALFVAEWDVEEPKCPFEDRTIMTKEVQGLRSEHNFAPETAIRDVTIALRRNLDQAAFDRVLATLPQGATQFWRHERKVRQHSC